MDAFEPTVKVLIVDDVSAIRLHLKKLLEKQSDFQVVSEADNGEECLVMAARYNPDVILMDVSMPVMDGIETARIISERHPQTKIIMLTASDDERDIFASLSAGAYGYCLKDFNPERIIAAIRGVQAGDIWLDSAIAAKVIRLYDIAKTQETAIESSDSGSARPRESGEVAVTLSNRELEVLSLVVKGYSNRQIAASLTVSAETVKTHMRHIMEKLAVNDRTHAAVMALRKGLV